MAFVPVPNGAKVAVEMTSSGQNVVNTFWFTKTGGFIIDDLEALAEAVWDEYAAFVAAEYGSGVSLMRVVATDMRTQFAPQFTTDHDPVVGTDDTGVALPNNVALCISKRSGLTGRSTRGRNYFLVQNSGNIAGQSATGAFAAAVDTLVSAIAAAAGTINWVEVVASFVQNGVPLATAVTYAITSHVVVDLTLDSMRRRLPGRGQ